MPEAKKKEEFLECEKPYVYWTLIFVAGWFGAYTFILRGGVFCNAQTANIVLFAIALGSMKWKEAAYLLVPIGAYFFGAFVSEYLGKTVKKFHFLRWDTLLLGIEALVVIGLGFLPESAPDQICQVALNFICSMQFNTFRQVKGVPAATTFVTNHIRQVGSNLAKYVRNKDETAEKRVKIHGALLIFFGLGGVVSTVAIHFFSYPSIWGSAFVLLVIFLRLAYVDRHNEKERLSQVPHGH